MSTSVAPQNNQALLKPNERVLSTLNADGRRRWLYPKLAKGTLWQRRRLVAWGLIAFFTVLPWLRYQGKPLLLLDVPARQFTILGYTYLPTDTLPMAFLMVATFLSIFFVTAVFGRVWCGWGCPQTVYMEFVFRPIERFFLGRKGVGGAPPKNVAAWRKVAMYAVFLLICAHLSNTFLAYFVGTDRLTEWIWTATPFEHPGAFLLFFAVTGLMMFDFAYWREQLCIVGCPYGRFQSVMLDRKSLIVNYDQRRGDPRGKPRKGKRAADVSLPVLGDCVDCNACVVVCPTGIDIRDGLQMECIHCAQCIDACNDVMIRFDRPTGLIRYGSQDGMEGKPSRILRPRVVLYPLAIIVMLSLAAYVLATKPAADVEVLRTLGRPFAVNADGLVENTLRVKITNRTTEPRSYTLALPALENAGELRTTSTMITLAPNESVTEPVQVVLPYEAFTAGRLITQLRVADNAGGVFDQAVRLQGPTAPPQMPAAPESGN